MTLAGVAELVGIMVGAVAVLTVVWKGLSALFDIKSAVTNHIPTTLREIKADIEVNETDIKEVRSEFASLHEGHAVVVAKLNLHDGRLGRVETTIDRMAGEL